MSLQSNIVARLAALFFLAYQCGAAATLSAPNQTAVPGQILNISLSFSAAGVAISGLQFDLVWTRQISLNAAVGDQLGGSTKVLSVNQIGPGVLRCMVVGINQDSIPDGELLKLSVLVDPNATAGVGTVRIANTVGATPAGNATALDATPFSIQIQPGGGGTNLALGKIATESSTLAGYAGAVAASAVDGRTDGNFFSGSVTATNADSNPWWQVDLGAAAVNSVVIWNRTDCCGSRLADYWVFISNTPFLDADTPATLQSRAGTFSSHQTTAPSPSTLIPAGTQGRYVRVQLSSQNILSLAEVQVFGVVPLTVSHIGNFAQGQPIAVYTVLVQNSGGIGGAGNVTVTDTLPAGLTATAIGGPGWTCSLGTVTCSRSDSLPVAGSYPPIFVTVSVAANAPSQVTNQVSLSGALGTASVTDATSIQTAFTDVSSSDLFLSAIDLLQQSGITTGCQASPPMYCSNDNVTEAQMAAFVIRSVIGSDNFSYTTTPYFSDVPANYPYFPWIQKMQDLGIALPCAAALYCPETAVTRGIMAVLTVRSRFGVSTPTNYPMSPYFTDVPSSHPDFPWIQKMRQLGITAGCTPTTYCPDDTVTRGQMAVFIMRGEFNQVLQDPGIPLLVWAAPAGASSGQTVTVTLLGQNTNFSGATQVTVGSGVTVSNVNVVNGTTLTAQLTVAGGAAVGPRSITVITGSEEATLPNWFRVQ